jgi:hypothetical protein
MNVSHRVEKHTHSFYFKYIVRKKTVTKDEELQDEGVEGVAEEPKLVTVVPSDGEYSSFPEIHRKTVDVLLKAGYESLFPI